VPAAVKLEQYLVRVGIRATQFQHDKNLSMNDVVIQMGVPCDQVIKEVLLIDLKGVVMAVIPSCSELDLTAVNLRMGRKLQSLHSDQIDALFPDCMPGVHPPVGMAYGVTTIVDQSIYNWPKAYMESGCLCTVLCLDNRGIHAVFSSAMKGHIAMPERTDNIHQPKEADTKQSFSLGRVADTLQKLYRLPPMPAVAMKILKMVSDPDACVADLAKLVELDPSLTAQVLRYARSSLFHFGGEVKTVKEAINLVLGFDRVANLAMGLAAGKAFLIPKRGILGLDSFWRHALYASLLSQKLAIELPESMNVDPGIAGLAGLLHNFGLLLIGHLFPPEFRMLSKLAESSPEQPLTTLEHQVFGMGCAQELIALGHGAIGGVLLRLWSLPEEIVKVAGMHQDIQYRGEAEHYVHLVQLVNELLKCEGIGDEYYLNDTAPMFHRLGLDSEKITDLTKKIIEESAGIDDLAREMSL